MLNIDLKSQVAQSKETQNQTCLAKSSPTALPFAARQIGTVPFLNAKPLVWDLEQKYPEIQQLAPRLIPGALLKGQLSVALLSSAFSVFNPKATVNRTLGIGSTGEVESILLFSECPWEKITKIYLDATSLAANNLVQVLISQKNVQHSPVWITPSLDQLDLRPTPNGSSAYLLIGDRALTERNICPPNFDRVYDLGAVWTDFTGLPFVFALWTYQPGLEEQLIKSMNSFIEQSYLNFNLELFLKTELIKYPYMTELQVRNYLTRIIQFELSADHLLGYDLYKKWMIEMSVTH